MCERQTQYLIKSAHGTDLLVTPHPLQHELCALSANGSRVATPKGSGSRRLLEVHMQVHKTLRYGGGLGTNAVQAVP